MSLSDIMDELPLLSSEERWQVIERAMALDDLSDKELHLIDERIAAHDRAPVSSVPLAQMAMRYLTETLTKIESVSGYRMRMKFEDGFEAELDLSPLLEKGPIFAPLRDVEFFRAVKLCHGVPVWSDDLDLSPGSLRAWTEAGRVLSIEETDEWVARSSPSEARVA